MYTEHRNTEIVINSTERIFQKKDTFLVEITHFISIFRSADLQQETESDNFWFSG